MFSATFEEQVQRIAHKLLRPRFITVSHKKNVATNHRITQRFLEVYQQLKPDKLKELLSADIEEAKKVDRMFGLHA